MIYGASISYDNGSERLLFHRDGDFWLTASPDLSSVQVEISEAQTPGQPGSSILAQRILPKTITFTGSIVRNIPENREKLLRVVAPGQSATITYHRGGRSYTLRGAPTRTPLVEAGIAVQDFQFSFRAPSPYWQDTEAGSTLVAGLESRFRLPFNVGGEWYISVFTGAYYQVVRNEGNVPVEMEIEIEAAGDLHDPVLLHMDRCTELRVQRAFSSGERLIVSTHYGRRGAVLVHADGSRENAFASLSVGSDLTMALAPGDNRLYFSAGLGRELARVTVRAPRAVVSGL